MDLFFFCMLKRLYALHSMFHGMHVDRKVPNYYGKTWRNKSLPKLYMYICSKAKFDLLSKKTHRRVPECRQYKQFYLLHESVGTNHRHMGPVHWGGGGGGGGGELCTFFFGPRTGNCILLSQYWGTDTWALANFLGTQCPPPHHHMPMKLIKYYYYFFPIKIQWNLVIKSRI